MASTSEKPLIRKMTEGLHAGRWGVLKDEHGTLLGNMSFSSEALATEMGGRWAFTGYLTTVQGEERPMLFITDEQMEEFNDPHNADAA